MHKDSKATLYVSLLLALHSVASRSRLCYLGVCEGTKSISRRWDDDNTLKSAVLAAPTTSSVVYAGMRK